MAKTSLTCPFSRNPCQECALFRGRHYYLGFARECEGSPLWGQAGSPCGPGPGEARGFAEIDAVLRDWERRNRGLDGTVTAGKRVRIRSNLRLKRGASGTALRLEEEDSLGTLLLRLSAILDFPPFEPGGGDVDPALRVAVNGEPVASRERAFGILLAEGDEVDISLVLVGGG